MVVNRLEAHLRSLCDEHPEYENLFATWSLNKKSCEEALKNVLANYPHYSMHDSSHAEAVISKIEMLLGDRVHKLSPTDTWLLLHSAYSHDLGMVISWESVKEAWKRPEFQAHLEKLQNSEDTMLKAAADFVKKHDPCTGTASYEWMLQAHRYVTLINASFFRGQHAQLSRQYLTHEKNDLGIDFGHSNMIQPRIVLLLSKICGLHTAPVKEVLDLDYKTNGFASDYAHPRFVAMLLRLGDLLDIDNGRFNDYSIRVSGELPDSSVPHLDKHQATTHLLVTPEEIQFSSDCPTTDSYLEARNFVTWLDDELDFLTKYWTEIAPDGMGGYAPRFQKRQLLLNGVPDIDGVAGLKFEISQSKAFQIIEGSNIYEDKFAFVREVIQNALDATKIQMWRDIVSGAYYAWNLPKATSDLQPFDIEEKVFENYPIKVSLSTLPTGETKVEISDRGTGISIDSFKRICNVGTSNAGSSVLQKEIDEMPVWLRPTAGFGVGLQSIFLVTDRFQINTCTGTDAYHAEFYSQRMGGYLHIYPSDKIIARGTTISLTMKMPESYSFSVGGDTDIYLNTQFDPMSAQDHTGEARVLEAIKKHCRISMFPLSVECSEPSLTSTKMITSLPLCASEKSSWKEWKTNYSIKLSVDCHEIQIWDRKKATYGTLQMVPYGYRGSSFLFKGIEVGKNAPAYRKNGLSASIDIYGLDTKSTITLDRGAFTQEGKKQSAAIALDMLSVYTEVVLTRLKEIGSEEQEKICASEKFNPYTFWLICDANQRDRIPPEVKEKIDLTAIVFEKDNGVFSDSKKPIKEIVRNFEDFYFINLHHFNTHMPPNPIHYEEIKTLLNSDKFQDASFVVASESLIEASEEYQFRNAAIYEKGDKLLLLYGISRNKHTTIETDQQTKSIFLRAFGHPMNGAKYSSYERDMPAKRYAISALKEYDKLAVYTVPYGISTMLLGNSPFIIAPFSKEEREKMQDLSKEAFVELVQKSPKFDNVVNWVEENSIFENKPNREEIIEMYKKITEDYYDAVKEIEGGQMISQ